MEQHLSGCLPKGLSTKAAHEVLKSPLSPPISRLRRAQQALIGRRRRVNNRNGRVRVSFAHSSSSKGLPRSGTRTSVCLHDRSANQEAPMQSSQKRPDQETPRRRDAGPRTPVARRAATLSNDTAQYKGKPASAATPSCSSVEKDGRPMYSLMQVPEVPGYYSATPSPKVIVARPNLRSTVPRPRRKSEYAHVRSLDGSSDAKYSKFPRPYAKRHASYVARAPPSLRPPNSSTVKPARDLGEQRKRESTISRRHKRLAVLDPLSEESHDRSLSQQSHLSCLVTPRKVKPRSDPSLPTLAPSEQRSLNRFAKELERYCIAVSANENVQLPLSTPSVSESPTTLDTVNEFLPYHRQFKAAGLAVTSREQMPGMPESRQQQLTSFGTRCPPVAPEQVDGGTVTPSDEKSTTDDAATVPGKSKNDNFSAKTTPGLETTKPEAASPKTPLVSWSGKKVAVVTPRPRRDRKISAYHIHPSRATTLEPVLTVSSKLDIIDAYFNSPDQQVKSPQPKTLKTSLPPPSPNNGVCSVDKPLPQVPQKKRRPIPPRSDRRHMNNTFQWPTAGVVIHDRGPLPDLGNQREAGTAAKVREDLPTTKTESSPPGFPCVPAVEDNQVVTPPKKNSPPPTQNPPPLLSVDAPISQRQRQDSKLGPSLCRQWPKATFVRHKSRPKSSSRTTAGHGQPETCTVVPDKPLTGLRKRQEKASPAHKTSSQPRNVLKQDSNLAPQLPPTWESTVGTSSSFEKAMDAVVEKLDDMEEKRQHERRMDLEKAAKTVAQADADRKLSSKEPILHPNGGFVSEPEALAGQSIVTADAALQTDDSSHRLDRDIQDSDVLWGLKMAICAACDEDLDTWIREKTGLRLRRFLADLKAFEAISTERIPSAPQPLHRQIRRNRRETERLKAEQERRRQGAKKTT